MDEEKNGNTADPRPGSQKGAGSGEPNPHGNPPGDGSGVVAPPATPPAGPSPLPLIPEVAKEADPLHVKIAVYDGPLDLLLDLIRKNEMNVYDIPVAEITRQYLDYLKVMKQLDLEVAGEFIVMAATLIYIKSKMLLPTDKDEEEGDGEDPRAELVRKLLEY